MKKLLIVLASLWTLAAGIASANTLELADGSLLEGDFVGSSNGIVMFNTGDGIEAFPEAEMVGIFLSDGVATRETAAPAQATASAPTATTVTIPAGTILETRLRVPVAVPR